MTKSNIFVEFSSDTATFNKKFEIVERKGTGHPDTICDLVMNDIEISLSKMYLKETGMIQHHNMDKAFLVAGQSSNMFGGGKVLQPMKIILGDRVTFGKEIPRSQIEEMIKNTAAKWFKTHLRFLKKEHVQYQLELGHASPSLCSIFKPTKERRSNDTSALVGYAPLTSTENAVLQTEKFLNSKKFKSQHSESGEDIKVMGFRNGGSLELTVAMAFVDSFISSEKEYFIKKEEIIEEIKNLHKRLGLFEDINITINNLDQKGKGLEGLYLTVLGTSADNSDSGEVGRGNRANQLISLSRPTGSESVAGKNSISHIGKIYNMLSFKIADEVYNKVSGVDEVFVWMYNKIGQPIHDPQAIIVQPITKDKKLSKAEINEIVEKNLTKMGEFCNHLLSGKTLIA